MGKHVATPKQTAGGGFVFEDKVVAYYLAWMLAGGVPFTLRGPITRVDCQVRVDGWILDDLLITCTKNNQKYRYAFSIKSNLQFTRDSAPKDFVNDAWLLYLHEVNGVFDANFDKVGLICVPQPDPPRTAIQSLLRKAHSQAANQLPSRLRVKGYASDEERSLFDSFTCPDPLSEKYGITREHIGDLLQNVIILEYDFENPESKDEATAVFLGQQILSNGSLEEGNNLWLALKDIAQRIRVSGGGITEEELWKELRSQFAFKELPEFSEDWYRLRAWRTTELMNIHERLGGIVHVDRDKVVGDIRIKLAESKFTALIGSSGTGKSAVAKEISEELSKENVEVLWFDAGRLRSGYIESFASHHGLTHPLMDVLENRRITNGLIVVDSAERLVGDDDFKEATSLLHILGLDQSGCTWRVLVLCQAEAWERVQLELIRHFGRPISWESISLSLMSLDDLRPAWQAFPSLRALVSRPHLRNLLLNPKILDILAVAIHSGQELDDRKWIGEWDVIKWYWRSVVRGTEKGASRSALLQKIAEKEANSGQFAIPEIELSPREQDLLPGMREILSSHDDNATISFAHDLFADWARLHVILSHEDTLAEFIKDKLVNPHWHKALRLYGVVLLDKDSTAKTWQFKMQEHPEIANFLLEALIFAGNSQEHLSLAWPILTIDNGRLLKDLLKRFLHVATIPNPRYIQSALEVGASETEARTWERLPLWVYWLGMLRFLSSHSEEVSSLVLIEVAQVAYTWLRYTPFDWPGRDDAAQLALATAWRTFRSHHYYHSSEKEILIPYKAVLEAFHDKPNEVREIALKACARIAPTEQDGRPFDFYEPPGTVVHSNSIVYGGDRIAQEPWPDGPLYRADDVFRAVCFNSDALRIIMEDDPSLAKEIILALMIEAKPPKGSFSGDDWHDGMLPERRLHLIDHMLFYPRFYTRGPFLLFLNINPQIALKTCFGVIDFATNRWIEGQSGQANVSAGVELNIGGGKKLYKGDARVFHWYHAITGFDVVTSVLMAVEKWFYKLVENKESIEEWISFILDEGRSLAWLGVLSEIGRHSPHLFMSTLQPLLLVPHTYYFEKLYERQGGHRFGTPYDFQGGEWFWKLTREWDTMEHRRYQLLNIAAQLFYSHEDTKRAIQNARENWSETQWDSSEDWIKFVELLIETFNQDNWKEAQLADGTTGFAFYAPKHLQPTSEQQDRSRLQLLLMQRPIECRTILDEKRSLDGLQIRDFLDQIKSISDIHFDDPDRASLYSPANSVAGTIAVLVNLHRNWLKSNPKEEKWCIAKLFEIYRDPPKWPDFDFPESVGNDTWEHFLCECVPVFWSENPQSKEWREFVANLVLVKHYSALQILLKRSFERRDQLGNSFWELVSFVLDWTIFGFEIRSNKAFNKIPNWHKKSSRKFINRKYSFSLLEWGKEALEKSQLQINYDHSRFHGGDDIPLYNRIAHVDFSQIQHVFSDIFMPNQAVNDSERELFFQFWDQALLYSLIRTKYYDKHGNEFSAEDIEVTLPYDYDYWILQTIANVILQMRQNENAKRYWEPILALGPRAEHWVERFLSHWFMDRRKSENIDDFIYHWKSMLSYCFSTKIWSNQKHFSYHSPKLLSNLLGFASFGGSLWEEDDGGIIHAMQEYFINAIPHIFRDSTSAARMIAWLSTKSAYHIRVEVLESISLSVNEQRDHWWQEDRLPTALARYLTTLWDEHRRDLQSSDSIRKAFEGLLHRVASLHEPLALELEIRITSR